MTFQGGKRTDSAGLWTKLLIWHSSLDLQWSIEKKKKIMKGDRRGLNPGPPAPEAGIIPLDYDPRWSSLYSLVYLKLICINTPCLLLHQWTLRPQQYYWQNPFHIKAPEPDKSRRRPSAFCSQTLLGSIFFSALPVFASARSKVPLLRPLGNVLALLVPSNLIPGRRYR